MSSDVSDRVREIAQYRGTEESSVIQEAVERGVEELWRDIVIRRYLDGDLSRSAAIDRLGQETVAEVDQARDAVEADVSWGLGEPDTHTTD